MTQGTPRVTVIIATYNWSSVLPYSIGSVLGQTFTDFELLVVGDGCSDDSRQVVGAIGDPRLRWIGLPTNSGHQSAPNNEGLRQARGELIAYLGHDDLWLPHHLQLLVARIDQGADLACGMIELVGPKDSMVDVAPSAGTYERGTWLPPSALMHRRSATDRVGGWQDYRQKNVYPETDLCLRIHDAGLKIALLPRLTAIKFPASLRRDSYLRREAKEQKAWSARIARESDFELREMARLIYVDKSGSPIQLVPFRRLCAMLLSETLRRIASRLGVGRNSLAGPRESIDASRRFRGLDPPR
jgi:glycosyltransferase involved in cell wall biosynthesis